MEKLDSFTRAYIQAALWSSCDDSERALDSIYSPIDLAPETREKIVKDCAKFLAENEATLYSATCTRGSGLFPHIEQAGHDFWLTRQGHGCGFWDGDWSEPEATILTDAAHKFGTFDLYVGDDGLIYA